MKVLYSCYNYAAKVKNPKLNERFKHDLLTLEFLLWKYHALEPLMWSASIRVGYKKFLLLFLVFLSGINAVLSALALLNCALLNSVYAACIHVVCP